MISLTPFLICWLSASAHAQDGFVQDHWTTRHGLPQNSATDIVQSPNGYLWMSTYGGLVRFDGRQFTPFTLQNTPGLEAVRFLSIAADARDRVYGGSEGQGLFRVEGGQAVRLGPPQHVWDIQLDPQGVVWAAGTESLRVEGDNVQVLHRALFHLYLHDQCVIGLGLDGEVSPLQGDCSDLPAAGPEVRGMQRWYSDPHGGVFASTHAGVYAWQGGAWRLRLSSPDPQRLRPISCAIWSGALWCGADAHPVPLSATVQALPEPSGADLSAALVDTEGGLWLGTDGDGVYRLDAIPAEHVGGEDSVFDLVEAPVGQIWYGYYRALQGIRGLQAPWPLDLQTVWQEGQGSALGTRPAQLVRLSELGLTALGPLPRAPHPVLTPVEGPWFTQDGWLYQVVGEEVLERSSPEALHAQRVRPILGDADEVWLVLDERRLVLWRQGELTREIDVGTFSEIRHLMVRDPHRLWIATYGSGLLEAVDDQIVGQLLPSQGGCDDMVSHIFDVGSEDLWFNTNRGLGRIPRATLHAAMKGERLTNCTLVGTEEGNGAQGLVDTQGHIWAPTIHGVAHLDPALVADRASPHVLLASAEYGLADLLRGEEARGPQSLKVSFVGLYFHDPHAVRYRYRLMGSPESDWSMPTTAQQTHYQNLAPGDYTFQVQARGLGPWSEPVTLTFHRVPTPWERPIIRYGLPLAGFFTLIGGLLWGLLYTRGRAQALQREIQQRRETQRALEVQRAQNAAIQRQVESGRRLESIGRLSAGIAHDFNNLFTVVAIHADMLAEHEDPEVREDAQGLQSVVESGVGVCRGLLTFGGRASSTTQADVGHRVQEILPLLRRLIRTDIALTLEAEPRCSVAMDPGQVDQIVTNLVLNARDASVGPGQIELRVAREAGQVLLTVRDHGRGMTEAQLDQALEPYFTTKALEQGTGLGLSTVHGLVQAAGGTLLLHSTPGEGTTVEVRLPWVPPAPSNPADAPQAPSIEGLRVLAVEDRPEVLDVLRTMLERMGCEVRVADSLPAAVEALRRGPLDLLISDVVMPHGNGPEVRDALRARQPGLPVLFMSGYVSKELPGLQPDDVLISKPFHRADLEAGIHRALSQAPQS